MKEKVLSDKRIKISRGDWSIVRTVLQIRKLASHVVAYHFCQADNNNTCLVPDLIHSLAAQLCQAPQLASYREYLLSEPHLQGYLSQRECTVDPDLALSRGIIEPLTSLRKAERLPEINMVILNFNVRPFNLQKTTTNSTQDKTQTKMKQES